MSIEFDIHVEHGHYRYKVWVVDAKDETEVSHPTRQGVVMKLAQNHLDDSEPAQALYEVKEE